MVQRVPRGIKLREGFEGFETKSGSNDGSEVDKHQEGEMKFIGTKGTRLKQLQGQGVTFIIRISKAAYKKTIDAGGFINYTPSPVVVVSVARHHQDGEPTTLLPICKSQTAQGKGREYYTGFKGIILITLLMGLLEKRKWKSGAIDDGKW